MGGGELGLLAGEMERVTFAMERVMARQPTTLDPPTAIPIELVERAPAIVTLVKTFDLTTFERATVLLELVLAA